MASRLDSLNVSLFIAKSRASTASNKTGSWSFSRPRRAERAAPCSAACPCAEDIPLVEMLASRDLPAEALATILEENPFPGVCGRVCFHPCESSCNRASIDEAVSINALERAASEAEPSRPPHLRAAARRKKIAIVGSGPSGLSAAYFLSRLGHECEILEAASEAGGLLRWGIPEYRLPSDVLRREIARVEALGVRIRLGVRADARTLSEAGRLFDALVVATGHGKPKRLGVPGDHLAGDALELLASVRAGDAPPISRGVEVVVVGGGNTAIDAARTLARLGAAPTIVYRRRREDMPAEADEVAAALSEGIRLAELAVPVAIEGVPGGLSLVLRRTRALGTGSDGRARFEPVEGSDYPIAASAIYSAVGALPSEPWMLPAKDGLARYSRCAIEIEGAFGIPTAYVGDLAIERESVSDAVASGKEAAIAIDALFAGGQGAIAAELERSTAAEGGSVSMERYRGGPRATRGRTTVRPEEINQDYVQPAPRRARLALDGASASFAEVVLGMDPARAVDEASRCLNCGVCNECDNCRTFCPEAAVDLAQEGPEAEGRPGRVPNLDYCKGCGICAVECPRGVLIMEEASS